MAALAPKYQPSARELTWHAITLERTIKDRLEWAAKMARDNDMTGLRAELMSTREWMRDMVADVDEALAQLDAMLPVFPPSESELRVLDGNR